jgi:8-oxo-dGTP pyrophosphatase MutT (NUDIX family)
MTMPSADWLRARFAASPDWTPLLTGDGLSFHKPEALRAAAVLVPVIVRSEGLSVLFTRRAAHLNDHAGQISFPGGRAEQDDPSVEATALREAREEIGLAPSQVEVLGCLHQYVTVTGYRVTPVVGLVHPPFSLTPDALEVAEIFEVPLPFLLDPANRQSNVVVHQGKRRHYYAFPYRDYYIWGATAGMLMNFQAFLRA